MWFFKKKELKDHLQETFKVKVHGMKFKIRRIGVLDHCSGAKTTAAVYDTYKIGNDPESDVAVNKIKSHFRDVLMAGIVEPELSRTQEHGKILVDNLFTDWDLASDLYAEIMRVTYGKKKFKQFISQGKNLLS